MTNPNVNNHIWNGTAWVPDPGSSGSGGSGTVAVSNFPATQPVSGSVNVGNFPATQPVSAAALPLPTGAATEASLGTDGAGESPANGTGIRGWLRSIFDKLSAGISITNFPATQPVSGTVALSGTSPVSGTVAVSNFPGTQPVSGTVAVSGTVPVSIAGTVTTSPIMGAVATSGTAALVRTVSAATTNSTLLKNSAGRIYYFIISNNSASVRYLKVYNKATAPTVGTDTPVMTLICPASSTVRFDFGGNIGQYFSLGYGIGITGAFADSDTTATAAGEIIVHTGAI